MRHTRRDNDDIALPDQLAVFDLANDSNVAGTGEIRDNVALRI
jgi:hypothetical protein